MKALLSGIVGVIIGIMIVSLIRNGEINWGTIGILITLIFLLLLLRLGLNLYKK